MEQTVKVEAASLIGLPTIYLHFIPICLMLTKKREEQYDRIISFHKYIFSNKSSKDSVRHSPGRINSKHLSISGAQD